MPYEEIQCRRFAELINKLSKKHSELYVTYHYDYKKFKCTLKVTNTRPILRTLIDDPLDKSAS